MGIKFGIFAPQGWRRDLNEIPDPYEQYEAMNDGIGSMPGPYDYNVVTR